MYINYQYDTVHCYGYVFWLRKHTLVINIICKTKQVKLMAGEQLQ